MCSISNGSRDISSTRSQRFKHHTTAICYISHYNLRSRRVTVKYSINRFILSSRRTFQPLRYVFYLKWFSWCFKYKVPAVSITRQPFVTSATITWYPGEIQWNTLLIDSSSHRGAHFCHWDMCSISNGSRDISRTRSQRIKHHTTAICYISHYNLRSRRVTVKYSINRLFLTSRRTFQPLRYVFYLKWFSWYFKYKVPAVSILSSHLLHQPL